MNVATIGQIGQCVGALLVSFSTPALMALYVDERRGYGHQNNRQIKRKKTRNNTNILPFKPREG